MVHVTVSTEQATAQEPKQVLYIVQEGDSIESVAQATGSSASAIQVANPGVSNLPNPGQAVAVPGAHAGQVVAVPGGQMPPGLLPIQPDGVRALPSIPLCV